MKDFNSFIEKLGPERVISILSSMVSESRMRRIDEVLANRICGLTAVMVRLHDPHNGAAVIRTAEGLGLQHIHAVEAGEPYRFATGITLGCEKWMTVHRHQDFESCRRQLSDQGFSCWAAVPDAPVPLPCVEKSSRAALVFGNERDGLDPQVIRGCDGLFRLPMWGFAGSFNLSVSVALSLMHLVQVYRERLGEPGDLHQEEKTRLKALWLCHSIRSAPQLLARASETPWAGGTLA